MNNNRIPLVEAANSIEMNFHRQYCLCHCEADNAAEVRISRALLLKQVKKEKIIDIYGKCDVKVPENRISRILSQLMDLLYAIHHVSSHANIKFQEFLLRMAISCFHAHQSKLRTCGCALVHILLIVSAILTVDSLKFVMKQ